MGYLKGLTGKDVIVSPLTVHKGFGPINPPLYSPTNGVSYFYGGPSLNYDGVTNGTESLALVGNSIKQLYYGNYIGSTSGLINTASLPQFNSDGTTTGVVLNNLYENNIGSIEELRYWDSPQLITVISISRSQFGDYIKPGSYSDDLHYDDGEGNIKLTSNNTWKGNIIYGAGLIFIQGTSYTPNSVSWKSSYTIYETQYKCTVGASELNYSLNPSLLKESGLNHILESGSIEYQDFVTGSYFDPYVTAVGLYNDNKELLAVGKLSQPLPLSKKVDTTILVNIDR